MKAKVKQQSAPPPPVSAALPGAEWNDEIEDDLKPEHLSSLVVFSRDWTIETINNQISQWNVDLNPKFQALITDYSLAFLDRHLKGDAAADPKRRLNGVTGLRSK